MYTSLSIRPIIESDIELLLDYWFNASPEYLQSMGVDLHKLPQREDFQLVLQRQLETPIELKNAYCLIWLADNKPIGHSNTNPTRFGEEAYMHLHLWDISNRRKGMGSKYVKMCIERFFRELHLKKLICEPFADNPAPHRTLEKAGFRMIREYTTTPGSINFEQPVKRWELTLADHEASYFPPVS